MAARVQDAPAFEDPVSVADALRLYVPVEASAAFFNGLVNGAVRLVFEQDKVPALRDIFADRGEVISAVHVPVESGSQISIVEAARRLGVKQEVMYHLINIGLVRTRTGKLQRRAARVVDVDDLQKFTEQFLPLFTGETIGISTREAPGWARQHGIDGIQSLDHQSMADGSTGSADRPAWQLRTAKGMKHEKLVFVRRVNLDPLPGR
ncbi:hypothetical protein [Caballeronia sordidicola]|uniref:hypothetical protein n=1 Tax=Caballeronia sordidicola TaxID=196367 RepID=UPI0004D00101|nr:hypothetical protein [Caballeronia sordidicola]